MVESKSKHVVNKYRIEEFETIFKALYPDLCRYCIQFVQKEYIAEDIVQELFIYLWEKRYKLKISTSIKAYLYKAVKNRSIDYLKSRYAKISFEKLESFYNKAGTTLASSLVDEEEISHIARRALDSLPEKCCTIFIMNVFGELSTKQIAEKLSISIKTVQNQIISANNKLKEFVKKNGIILLLLVSIFFTAY